MPINIESFRLESRYFLIPLNRFSDEGVVSLSIK